MNALEKQGQLMNQESLFFALPFEKLFLQVDYTGQLISKIQYTRKVQPAVLQTPFGKLIVQQLEQYFRDSQSTFSLNCQINQGTAFQQQVWQALLRIPAGEVKTYGALAEELGSSPRAVGNACRNNLFPLVIPCHRVVSASGIGGYAGDTLQQQRGDIEFMRIKQWLLAHEQSNL